MFRKPRYAFLAGVLIGGMIAISPTGKAAESAASDPARAGIERTLDKVNALLKQKASAQDIADALYEDDLMVTGEGEKSLYRDLKSFMEPLAHYLEGGERCALRLVDPIRHSGSLAVAFVFEHCAPEKAGEAGEDARIMYVFRNGTKGWRATMETWSWGTF
jgi:hypothetical protein